MSGKNYFHVQTKWMINSGAYVYDNLDGWRFGWKYVEVPEDTLDGEFVDVALKRLDILRYCHKNAGHCTCYNASICDGIASNYSGNTKKDEEGE